MKKLFIKIIIWLFEKYSYDEWVDIQENKQRADFKREHNLKDNEVEEAMIDIQQEPTKEAYDAGFNDGVNKVLKN